MRAVTLQATVTHERGIVRDGGSRSLLTNPWWLPWPLFLLSFLNIFFGSGPFLQSLLNLLQHCFCVFWVFFFGQKAGDILAPWPGIKPATPALEGKVLTTRSPRKSSPRAFRGKSRPFILALEGPLNMFIPGPCILIFCSPAFKTNHFFHILYLLPELSEISALFALAFPMKLLPSTFFFSINQNLPYFSFSYRAHSFIQLTLWGRGRFYYGQGFIQGPQDTKMSENFPQWRSIYSSAGHRHAFK